MSTGAGRYPEYRDSGLPWLGEIPAHWEVRRLKYLFEEIDARSVAGEETHLSMSQRHGLVPSNQLSEKSLQSDSYAGGKLCEAGDLVLNRLKAHLGVFARAKQPGVVSPDYAVYRLRGSGDIRYFEFLLRTPLLVAELRKRTKGIVEGFWRLYTEDFFNILVPVPPPHNQTAIANYLDAESSPHFWRG